MAALIAAYPGESLSLKGDAFGTLVRAIIGQQVSVKAADAIVGRLEERMEALSPQHFLKIEPELLREAGLSRQKITYLTGLSEHYLKKPFTVESFAEMTDAEVTAFLVAFKGIGRWTAEMFLFFCLGRPDIFPVQDIGIQKAIAKHYDIPKDKIEKFSLRWQPYRTVATWYLWRSLDPIPVAY